MASLVVWLVFAKSLAFVVSLILPLLLVRRLSQSEFGSYKQAFLVIGTAISVLPLGFGTSTFYFLPREDKLEAQKQIIFNVVLFNFLVGALVFLLLWMRSDLFSLLFHDSKLVGSEVLIGSVVLFWIFSSFLETIAIANQEAKIASIFIFGAQLSKAILFLVAALLFGTIYSLIVAALVHAVIQTLVLLCYLNIRFRGFWLSFDWSMLRRQLSYALPYGATALLFVVQTDLHNYFVANRFDAATFAIYSIGCLQLPFLGILTESLASAMIPRLSLLQKENNKREIVILMTRIMRKLAIVHFPLYAFLMINGRDFIRWLFTDAYAKSWPIFAVNLTLIPFYVIMLDPIVRAYAEQRYFLVRLRLILSAVLIVSLFFAIRFFGPLGVIVVVVSINLFEHFVITWRSAQLVGFEKRDVRLLSDVGKLALAALTGALATLITRPLVMGLSPFYVLVMTGTVFLIFYIGIIFLWKVPTPLERAVLTKRISVLERVWFWKRTAEPSV